MPRRIQRLRTRGWTAPEEAVYVGRGSLFGNPFTVADALAEGFADNEADARRACVDAHRDWLAGEGGYRASYTVGARTYDRYEVAGALLTLVGHDLMCWCRTDQACHADTLLAFASRQVR